MNLFLVFTLGLSIAAGTVSPAPGVQLAGTYRGGIDVRDYLVSEKLDGVRGRWNGVQLQTRSGHVIAVPRWFIANWPSVPLDGELWIARGQFDKVSGIVRKAQAGDAAWREVRFMVFDLPGSDSPFARRAEDIRRLLDAAGIPWLQPVPQFRVANTEELDARLASVVAGGGEGLVLHHQAARYRSGRSDLLLKYKPFDDAEARVVAYLDGKGKYAGQVGSLLVERDDGVRFRVGSGLDDADRANPPPIGSRITYRYNGLTANGLPRFPRYLRVREGTDE